MSVEDRDFMEQQVYELTKALDRLAFSNVLMLAFQNIGKLSTEDQVRDAISSVDLLWKVVKDKANTEVFE